MKSKADEHREAGTLDEFRARQAASRASTARHHERVLQEAEAARLEIRDLGTDHERIVALETKVATLIRVVNKLSMLVSQA